MSRGPDPSTMDAIRTGDGPTFPTLDPGVTLLTTDGRSTGALQSLVLDRVLLEDGTALWVDADGHASTTSLATIAPSRRTLDRIRVARAFTAFQHYSLLEALEDELAAVGDAAELVVAPSIEWFYANDDLRGGEGAAMLTRGLESLSALAADHDVPVLLSRSDAGGPDDGGPDDGSPDDGGLGDVVAAHSDAVLECTRTQFGPRFAGADFETLVYECRGGVQTTLAFWQRALERRHAAVTDAAAATAADGREEVVPVGTH